MTPLLVAGVILVVVLVIAAAPPRRPQAAPAAGSPAGRSPLTRLQRTPAPGPLDVARLVERLATVTASGVAPRRAWSAVADSLKSGPLTELARAVGTGGDPRRAATGSLAHSGEIASLGAALSLCERTGAPTGPILLTLAGALRDVADAELARRSAFAGPLATARILLGLPLAGLGLGMLLGADPLAVLLHGSGLLLLLGGLALTAAGWWWMRSLLSAAQARGVTGVDPSIVLDLVAGPLAAGAPLADALVAVAAALGPDPSAPALHRAGQALRAGAPVSVAVQRLPLSLTPLREAALVGAATGADLVSLLRTGGADARRGRARDAEAAAARLAVRLVLPTGVTLLPAFVLLGIIPTVASLLDGSFGSLL